VVIVSDRLSEKHNFLNFRPGEETTSSHGWREFSVNHPGAGVCDADVAQAFGRASVASESAARCLRSAPVATVASAIAAGGAEADSGATGSGRHASAIRKARPERGPIAAGSMPTVSVVARRR
jgi:hypothetical protein